MRSMIIRSIGSALGLSIGLAAILTTTSTLAASTLGAVGKASEVHAVPFVKILQSALPDPDWRHKVCQLTAGPLKSSSDPDLLRQEIASCEHEAPDLYRAKDKASGSYYTILSGPKLVKVSFAVETGWKVLQNWDFSDHPAPEDPEDREEARFYDIYPALYPLGGGRFAAALTSERREMYLGGEADWTQADFIELQPDGGHANVPRVASLPFSCDRTIRGSGHSFGSLRLRFVPGANKDNLDWVATWKETFAPEELADENGEDTSASARKYEDTSVSARLPAGQAPAAAGQALRDKISFCDGGP